jgi:beta-mannosidase
MAAARVAVPLETDWRYRSTTATETARKSWRLSRKLPTEVHLDLLADGAIPDPFVGNNEKAVQWVGQQVWEYERQIALPEDAFSSHLPNVTLVFEGLDTFATVTLNGRELLRSDNMFVCHRVVISRDMLVEGRQHLHLVFHNAEQAGEAIIAKYPQHEWFSLGNGTARLATRKAQYHYVSVSSSCCCSSTD